MIDSGKHSVIGVNVDAVDYEAAVAKIMHAAIERQSMSVTALAVHGVMTGYLDREQNYRLNRFDLVCPDGQPVRWALNLLHGCGLSDRVYGPELTLRLCQACVEQQQSIFLFGGTDEMNAVLIDKLAEKFPGLKVAGARASRFRTLSPEECSELADEINASGASLCFVGIGCPRQETFAFEMRDRISMPLIAVGAAFAFHANLLPQAPSWMQRAGLEWLFRLVKEPTRLWRRYLYLNPMYLSLLALQRLGIFKGRTDDGTPPQQEVLFG
ncbi:WecB/TagA/CpsF family glycosyltransferase [Rosistilla oblonga]|uniref:WecB/TagA/CpsF family glycosyltransferase n=1 Tax=Rosistilla oblonga TaxID=2527990 RepID=UPI003A975DE1